MKLLFPGNLLSSVALVALAGCGGHLQEKKSAIRPNVIFIYADDIGYGDFSCNGTSSVKTPNVDRLASEGIRFTNAHACASTSTPSRYAMLTGEYAWRRKGTGIANGDAGMVIPPERMTIADMFKQAGYETAVIGKWHLGLGDSVGTQDWNHKITPGPADIGFDYSYIMAATGDRVPCVWIKNQQVENLDLNDPIEVSYKVPFPGEPTYTTHPELATVMHPDFGHDQSVISGIPRIGYMKGGHSARWKDANIGDTITINALRFIEKYKDGPFFLYLGTNDIHVPRVPHPRFTGKSGLGPRGDAILEFDYTVGKVIGLLDSLGIAENTLIFLSSDNGPVVNDGYADLAWQMLGDHKPWGKYRGGKYSSFEAGTRIPCVVRWPGKVKPQVSDALVSQIDWFASLAKLIGVNLADTVAPDSRDQLEVWLGKSSKGRDYVIEQSLNNNLSVLTSEGWKYIQPNSGAAIDYYTKIELANNPLPQLYDTKNDPGEKKNLAVSEKSRLIKLKKILNDEEMKGKDQ
ncbi:sulfatase family protein [Coprobacter tertius]|uniref:Arylsulfatase n=1 Tax=Coprobacter tertius TaxID=2944915 RepID=A0ABT1MJ43_9BACT|nr:arylsulfatase [Coprobacter tertius]MCP9612640.1 arylsulfatase [Coprobacter tertius]